MRVAVSIGHSSKDSGATARHNNIRYREYDLNKALFKELVALPLRHAEWWQSDQLVDDIPYPDHLIKTVRQINAHPCVCAIELHHNSVWNKDVRGGMCIYWDSSIKGKLLSDMITWQMSFMPKSFGFEGVKKHWVNAQSSYYTVGSKRTIEHIGRRLYYLRKTKVPAVIIEPTFISNYEDCMFGIRHRKEIAKAIRNGIDAWCKANEQKA